MLATCLKNGIAIKSKLKKNIIQLIMQYLHLSWDLLKRFMKKSKLQKSSFMYITYCKLCPLSSIITENVLDVCKALQVMSFSPNLVNLLRLNLTK
ncbi:hypothetical protein Hanom_Chr04g00342451 [Helianthus anomalus]